MKKALLLAVVMVMSASLAFAQAGSVGVFADAGATNCNLVDAAPGLLTVNLVHVLSAGATAAQFAAPVPACFIGTYLSDGQIYPVTIGNSQTGVAIGYGSCVPSPNLILTISLFAQGLTGNCCYMTVIADPNVPSGEIEIVDCSSALWFGTGGTGIFNSDPSCNCNVANDDATWGKVKALYE